MMSFGDGGLLIYLATFQPIILNAARKFVLMNQYLI